MASVGPLVFSWVCVGLLLLVLSLDRHSGQADRLVRASALAWVVAAGLNAVIGLLQYVGQTSVFGVWVNHTGLGEAFGNLRQRNQFATLMNLGLLAQLWWAGQLRSASAAHSIAFAGEYFEAHGVRHADARWVEVQMGLVVALLAVGNAASSSRTGLLQLALVVGLVLWWQPVRLGSGRLRGVRSGQLHRLLLIAVLSYAIATFALPWLIGLDPFASGAWARLRSGDALCASRLTLWGNVLDLIAHKPWRGWGWGELDYAHFVTLYPGARFCDILDNAHNLPLQLAVELGVPMALLLCGTGLWLVWRANPWRETDVTRQFAWGVLAVILLHSLLEYPLWYGPFQIAAGLSVWIVWWVPRPAQLASASWTYGSLSALLKGFIAIVVIAFCGVVAANYHQVSQIYKVGKERAPQYQDNTLEKIRGVWFFQDQLHFAELTTAGLTPDNARYLHNLALDLLHFSPEARVAELLLDSAVLLGKSDEVAFYAPRYQAAFLEAYGRWLTKKTGEALPD